MAWTQNCGCQSERRRRRRDIAQDPELIYPGRESDAGRGTVASAGDGKVRLGWDSGDRKFEIADAVRHAGASELVVHGRTKRRAPRPSISTGRRSAKYASV